MRGFKERPESLDRWRARLKGRETGSRTLGELIRRFLTHQWLSVLAAVLAALFAGAGVLTSWKQYEAADRQAIAAAAQLRPQITIRPQRLASNSSLADFGFDVYNQGGPLRSAHELAISASLKLVFVRYQTERPTGSPLPPILLLPTRPVAEIDYQLDNYFDVRLNTDKLQGEIATVRSAVGQPFLPILAEKVAAASKDDWRLTKVYADVRLQYADGLDRVYHFIYRVEGDRQTLLGPEDSVQLPRSQRWPAKEIEVTGSWGAEYLVQRLNRLSASGAERQLAPAERPPFASGR